MLQTLPKVTQLIFLLICHSRFFIFLLKTLKFEWQCSQYLKLNPTSVLGIELEIRRDVDWIVSNSHIPPDDVTFTRGPDSSTLLENSRIVPIL